MSLSTAELALLIKLSLYYKTARKLLVGTHTVILLTLIFIAEFSDAFESVASLYLIT